MFEKFSFTKAQIQDCLDTALRDIKIADESEVPEVIFRFSYDAFLRFAITFCAKKGLRVKSKTGHHVELIRKLAEFLQDKEVEVIGNEMRGKRNIDLYRGGTLVSKKEADEYCEWVGQIIEKNKGKII